jgi:hypothetical protein
MWTFVQLQACRERSGADAMPVAVTERWARASHAGQSGPSAAVAAPRVPLLFLGKSRLRQPSKVPSGHTMPAPVCWEGDTALSDGSQCGIGIRASRTHHTPTRAHALAHAPAHIRAFVRPCTRAYVPCNYHPPAPFSPCAGKEEGRRPKPSLSLGRQRRRNLGERGRLRDRERERERQRSFIDNQEVTEGR